MSNESINNFVFSWRWTDPIYFVMPKHDLELIEPLDKNAAKIAWKKSLEFASNDNCFSPNSELFNEIESIDAEDDNSEIYDWLSRHIDSARVIVSWQQEIAVIASSHVFIKYWGEFCYPASDDVSIWPENETWVIHYWHEKKFWYGKRLNV